MNCHSEMLRDEESAFHRDIAAFGPFPAYTWFFSPHYLLSPAIPSGFAGRDLLSAPGVKGSAIDCRAQWALLKSAGRVKPARVDALLRQYTAHRRYRRYSLDFHRQPLLETGAVEIS
jgi:hypothetical protein